MSASRKTLPKKDTTGISAAEAKVLKSELDFLRAEVISLQKQQLNLLRPTVPAPTPGPITSGCSKPVNTSSLSGITDLLLLIAASALAIVSIRRLLSNY